MILVSACLLGVNCKYNGGSNWNKEVIHLINKEGAVPICPEQLGGFTTPRPKTEILRGTGADVLDLRCRVTREDGDDVTDAFIKGAQEVLKIAKMLDAKKAVLRSKSPSCGVGCIYDGTFSGRLVEGNGVTAELLIRNGLEVISEKDLE
ncbi:MAG TPA: DUF523 domain-containing protein [Pseudobacteroides sp.]|uniref:DUF523 domain-containing protein n=1 Tax=Pseudobacteroides sp. TaxID=1968840 RepID=UPI002F9418E9